MGWGDAPDPKPPAPGGSTPADCTIQSCGCESIAYLTVEALAFIGDHGVLTDYVTDFKAGGKSFPKPEFERRSGRQDPVSFSMGQVVEVELTFLVGPANACTEHGTLVGRLAKDVYFAVPHTFVAGVNKARLKAKRPLAAMVQVLDFNILWEAHGISADFILLMDFTQNAIYVTYDKPYNDTGLDNQVTLKRLLFVCSVTVGDTDGHVSLKKLHDARGKFDLDAVTPRPTHWIVADGTVGCQCVDLAKFWQLAAEMLGIRAGQVVYLYPKLGKGTKVSTSPEEPETRTASSSTPPHDEVDRWHHTEELTYIDNAGGWNAYEACYELNHKGKVRYYAGGAEIYETPEQVMADVCTKTIWIFRRPKSHRPIHECTRPGPYPAEVWK
jgi:hypothetical protein